ncbi:MAG TPA: c-type cytochrome domain-containing protein [Pirellulales bacterium]|nr:c-type cytochrome domain-containing protein [Pirellulales bacterium]
MKASIKQRAGGRDSVRRASFFVFPTGLWLASLVVCFVGGPALAQEQPAGAVSFSKDIAPILLKNCQACHGASDAKGGFQLGSYTALMKPGDSASASITPGKPDDSEVLRLIASQDKGERMPKDGDPLPADKIALVRKWIEEGAKYDANDPNATLASIVPKEPRPPAPQAYPRTIPVTSLAFRPDGQELAVGGYYEITIWNPATGALVRRIGNVDQRTFALAYNKDGTVLAAASGTPGISGEVALFDPNQGTVVKVLGNMPDNALDVQFNPAGDKLAACSADRSIRIYNVASGAQEKIIEDHADWVMGIAWSPDGTKLASASRDKTAKVFDAVKGESLATFPGHQETVYGVSFSADGAQVFTGGGNKVIHVWNPNDGNKIADIGGFGGEVFKLLVRNDMLFSCSADKTARQHKTADRSQVRVFSGHTDWVFSLAHNEATQRLATGSFDGEVRVWNLADGAQVAAFKAAPGFPPAQPPAAATAAAK